MDHCTPQLYSPAEAGNAARSQATQTEEGKGQAMVKPAANSKVKPVSAGKWKPLSLGKPKPKAEQKKKKKPSVEEWLASRPRFEDIQIAIKRGGIKIGQPSCS